MLFIKTKEVRPEGMPEVFQVAAPIIDQSVQHLQEIQTLEEGTRELWDLKALGPGHPEAFAP